MSSHDNYSVRDYGRMIADAVRTAPYVEALRRAVRPGHVVLDIGTGPGFFALLACQLGAGRVYAIEPDDAIEIGRESARHTVGGERIRWIRGLSTDVELPERVDVVVGDLHGMLPFYAGHLTALIDARARHLKPGGVMIPHRDVVFAVPAEAPDEYASILCPWEHNDAGVDLAAGRRFAASQWWRAATPPITAGRCLASPDAWTSIDYRHCRSPDASGECTWTAARSGTLHGYYVWFDGETAEGIGFSNAPTLPERVYGRAFFPLERPVEVTAGDLIRGTFAAHLVADEYILRWNTAVEAAQGATRARFTQSTFGGRPVCKEDVERARPDYRPILGESGRVDLVVLEAISRGESLAEIADRLVREFPQRYTERSQALRRATDLSLKYAGR